jgi:hypothetical protein
MRPVRIRPLAAALAGLLLLPACDGDSAKPSPQDPQAADRGRLAVLAQATANGAYDATYEFVQAQTSKTGKIRIRQNPPQYRIDVISAKDEASYFALSTGVVSCSRKATKKTCFLVAKPGEEVPALFDPGVQRLFQDAVQDLASHPTDYSVAAIHPETPPSATPAPDGVPAGECFFVERLSTPTPGTTAAGFEDGTYCFAEQGLATRIEVASGTLVLTAVRAAPDAKSFLPIAPVQKLPDLTPTPTKSTAK